uniref:Uncharacterized protein n=1 Tax=Bactrocera dorsalis TaxID=27457 RepID=A0A034VWY0_BACDO
MTSFGGNEVREGNFTPTFKIHGQVYHVIGSLLPAPNTTPKFLQIYLSSEEEQLSLRQSATPTLQRGILKSIQEILRANNVYVRSFKTSIDRMPTNSNNYKVVIHA